MSGDAPSKDSSGVCDWCCQFHHDVHVYIYGDVVCTPCRAEHEEARDET